MGKKERDKVQSKWWNQWAGQSPIRFSVIYCWMPDFISYSIDNCLKKSNFASWELADVSNTEKSIAPSYWWLLNLTPWFDRKQNFNCWSWKCIQLCLRCRLFVGLGTDWEWILRGWSKCKVLIWAYVSDK